MSFITQARVAGESRNIDANKIRELAEHDDRNWFNHKEVLSLVNHGNLKFTKADADYVRDGLLKWISFYMNKGGFRYRLTLDFKKGAFVGYACSAHPSFARPLEVETKVKASNPIISAGAVEKLFNKVKLASKAKLGTIIKTPASFKLGRFDMEKRKSESYNNESTLYIGFASKEVDSEKNPLVSLLLDVNTGVVRDLLLAGSSYSVENDEPTDLTEEGCSVALRNLLNNTKYQNFEDIVSFLNSNKELSKILSELKPQVGSEERIIGISVKNYTPIGNDASNNPGNYVNDEHSAYVVFKDAATRNTALEALRKVISDNGGKIVYEDELKIKEGA